MSSILKSGQHKSSCLPASGSHFIADSTVYKAPEGIDEKLLVLMANIFPTNYFAASSGFKESIKEQIAEPIVVIISYGLVGLLMTTSLLMYWDIK